MAKPNLALIPATIGDKVYSILPSDGVGDFDFTRATTATRINAQGLIETVASGENRLNYPLIDGVVSGCPSLLLEPSRTNLIPYSEDFNNAAWIKQSGITVSDNDIISPDGTQNADKITTTNSSLFMYDVLSLTPSIEYTVSFFIKNDNSNKTRIWGAGEGSFDMTWNGSQLVSITQGSFEYFGNEWYKVSVTQTSQSDGQYITRIYPSTENVTTDSIYLWGFQVEEGSYGTSYIKSTSAAVTRAAETCNGSGDAATFNDSSGVLMAEIAALADDQTQRALGISDGTSSNRMSIVYNDGSSNALRMFVTNPSGTKSYITNSFNITQNNKISIKLNGTNLSFWVNGFEIHTDTLNSAFGSDVLDTLDFAFYGSNTPFYGKTKQIQYFDTTLTDAQLEQLTSWDSFRAMAQSQLYSVE